MEGYVRAGPKLIIGFSTKIKTMSKNLVVETDQMRKMLETSLKPNSDIDYALLTEIYETSVMSHIYSFQKRNKKEIKKEGLVKAIENNLIIPICSLSNCNSWSEEATCSYLVTSPNVIASRRVEKGIREYGKWINI